MKMRLDWPDKKDIVLPNLSTCKEVVETRSRVLLISDHDKTSEVL